VAWPDVGQSVEYDYDRNDNLTEVVETKLVRSAWATAGAGVILAGDATGTGRWLRVAYTSRAVYDGLDRLERATDGYWGTSTEFWYNRAGARTGVFVPGETASVPPGGIPSSAPSLTYRYDAQNGLTSATRAVPTTGKLSTGNVPASRGRSAAPAAGRPAHCGHEPFQTS